MAELVFSIKDNNKLEKIVLQGLVDIFNKLLDNLKNTIPFQVGEAASLLISESDEYKSLIDGQLRHELGVIDAGPILESVINNIYAGGRFNVRKAKIVGNQVVGSFTIELLKGDYSEVLSVDGASFISEGNYNIEWLKWLTLEGDRILVMEHHFVSGGNYDLRSRTGQGIMIRPGYWKVPAQYSGTEEDNWITRALVPLPLLIEDMIKRAL